MQLFFFLFGVILFKLIGFKVNSFYPYQFVTKADHDAILNQLKEEKEHAVEEILMLSKKIGRLEEAVSIKEDETDKLCK